MKYLEPSFARLLFLKDVMIALLNLVAVLALLVSGIVVMIGAVKPEEMLRRVGVILLLLLVVPVFILNITHCLLAPMFMSFLSFLKQAAYVVLLVTAIGLLVCIVIRQFKPRLRVAHREE
jgi:hypothetical protein